MNDFLLKAGRKTLMLELQEASRLPDRLGDDFIKAAKIIIHCQGKVIVSGIGKSGHIGRKIAATLASTGTPAFFLHPTEALHGDLGIIQNCDVMLFISYSGTAKELNLIIPNLQEKSVSLLAITGNPHSFLAFSAKAVLDISVEQEACPMHLSPTASAVNTLMIGDALAMAIMQARGFNKKDFARFHPEGALGAYLHSKVHHLMRTEDTIPQINFNSDIMHAIVELNRTKLGIVVVCDEKKHVKGVFTDSDLLQWLVREGSLRTNICKAMTRSELIFHAKNKAIKAKEILIKSKITIAPVVDDNHKLIGVINLQDFYQSGIIP